MRLMLQRYGTVDNPQVECGNPVLCAEIMSAERSKNSPTPDEQTYLVFKNATLDFTQ
ncbi:TPA: hypothetical protein L9L07_004943 [Klebsiella pneumoniae]|nr:hypothetical protein [Klebsiella pneumoniae]HBR1941262.1 hypothetical protein [Klebsiella pneumoniae]